MPERFTGYVKWFSPEKGYGFIRRSRDLPDIFVHATEVIIDAGYKDEKLENGERVEFDIVLDKKSRPTAANVVRIREE